MTQYLRRFTHAFLDPEVRLITGLVVILLVLIFTFAVIFSGVEEGVSFFDGLWAAYVTLTTIGYGDYFAKTGAGRIVTIVISMFGIGCFAVFTGMILEKAMQRRMKKMRGEKNYSGTGHLVIVNVPSYEDIKELLKELDLSPDFRDMPRVLITASLPGNDKEIPDTLVRRIHGFVMGIPSSMETLRRANVPQCKACLLLSSTAESTLDDTNTLTAGLIEKHWPEVITILSCSRAETMENLKLFSIDGGVSATDLQMGLLVQELEDPGVFEVYRHLSTNTNGNQVYISKTPVGQWFKDIQGLTIGDLKLAAHFLDYPAEILGIKNKHKNRLDMNPPRNRKLEAEDHLVYMAEKRFWWIEYSEEILKQIEKNTKMAG